MTADKYGMRAQFVRLQEVLEAEPAPVLADETMGMLVISGHRILLQPFELTQLAHQGLWDQTRLLDDLRAHKFGIILINDGPATPKEWTKERWTEEMLATIHAEYEPTDGLAMATVYRPKKLLGGNGDPE
jgi:hypothetical protein